MRAERQHRLQRLRIDRTHALDHAHGVEPGLDDASPVRDPVLFGGERAAVGAQPVQRQVGELRRPLRRDGARGRTSRGPRGSCFGLRPPLLRARRVIQLVAHRALLLVIAHGSAAGHAAWSKRRRRPYTSCRSEGRSLEPRTLLLCRIGKSHRSRAPDARAASSGSSAQLHPDARCALEFLDPARAAGRHDPVGPNHRQASQRDDPGAVLPLPRRSRICGRRTVTELEEQLQPLGFFRSKAQSLIGLGAALTSTLRRRGAPQAR